MPYGRIARTAELVIVSLFVTCSAFADCLDFAATRAYPGFRGGLVAVADFNGDGKKDVALSSSGNLSVLLGTGDGSFSSAFDYPIGLRATGGPVAAGDFNGDGKSDLIRADGLTTNVLIGHGDGTFSAPKPLPTGSPVMSVAIGDFNADGRRDVATITFDGRLTIFLGNGDGAFAVATQYELGSIGWTVVTADLNGDGKIDIAAAAGTGVTVFLGKGNGTFASGVSYAPGVFYPKSLAVADLDGDGRPDLVAGAAGEGSAIAVFPGKGDGTFGAAVLTSFNDYPWSVNVADLDADGKPDVVVTGFSTVYVYRGTGRFSLDSPTTYENGAGSSFLIDDLNADGKLDLVLGGGIMFGRGDGTFPAAMGASGGGRFLALGDFNADGRIDIATAGSGAVFSPGVTILLGIGNGTFANPVLYSTPQPTTSFAVGDMNGDGKIDLIETCQAVRDTSNVFVGVQLGNGDGTFGAVQKYPLPPSQPESITIADLNGDHRNDVVVMFTGSTAVLLNQGDGTLTAPTQYTVGTESAVAADFNGDGKNDLAVADVNYWVSVLLGHGDGTFGAAAHYPVFPLTPASVTTGDFNGDGIPDLAAASVDTGIAVLLGKGDGSFAPATFYYGGRYAASAAAADFNGDGIVDLVVSDRDSAAISIFVGKGDGTFASPVNYETGFYSTSVRAADFDGDGRTDVVVATGNNWDKVTIILNTSFCRAADVKVTMALGGSPPLIAGSTLTYTINVGNSGPGAASQVVVTDVIPAGAVFVSASPSQGTCSGVTPITCVVGSLANGATATIKLAIKSGLTPSVISNAATVVSANDPNSSNNSATSTAQTASASTVPTLSLTALVLLSLGLALVASVAMRR